MVSGRLCLPGTYALSLTACTHNAIATEIPHAPINDAVKIQKADHCAEFISFRSPVDASVSDCCLMRCMNFNKVMLRCQQLYAKCFP